MCNALPRLLFGLALLAQAATAAAQAPPPTFGERFGDGQPSDIQPAPPAIARQPIPPSTEARALGDVMRNPAALPAPVAATRERIMAAARTGDPDAVLDVAREGRVATTFDEAGTDDVAGMWRAQYPESGGLEVLAILLDVLDAGFVRVEAGTPNEMWVWPYFAQAPLDSLGAAERVELHRLVTAADLQLMRQVGDWTFFRLGIAPDGAWHYFFARE
jgi:hypothetical protein